MTEEEIIRKIEMISLNEYTAQQQVASEFDAHAEKAVENIVDEGNAFFLGNEACDGNCVLNAILTLFGTDPDSLPDHRTLRDLVVEKLKENPERYKQYFATDS